MVFLLRSVNDLNSHDEQLHYLPHAIYRQHNF